MIRRALPLLAAAILAAGCSAATEEPTTATSPAPATTAAATPRVSAGLIVQEINEVVPVPNPRDNTASCKAAGCVGLVTTDSVSVYEWADVAAAKRWAAGLPGTKQVGRFVLSWGGSEQKLTSQEARADMVKVARRLTG